METYYACSMVNSFFLTINGRLDDEKCLTFCCEPIDGRPAIVWGNDASESLVNIINKRQDFLEECRRVEKNGFEITRELTAGCVNCAYFQKKMWNSDGRIHYVNLSMYPSPCQCKCFYCDVHRKDQRISAEMKKEYDKMFDMLEFAKKCNAIASDARWQVSCGEITIHPFKERILDLVEGYATTFYTNGFKFDERIAWNLKNNPYSAIDVSIDAGTPSTWYKVKGVNNFEDVAMNLMRYSLSSKREGQIVLKYIVFPGINDSEEDYISLIEMMKLLKTSHLTISRDSRKKYKLGEEETSALVKSAARLAAICFKNGIANDMFTYTMEEQKMIVEATNHILENA